MRHFFPVEELARDERFHKVTMRDRMADPRSGVVGRPDAHAAEVQPTRPRAVPTPRTRRAALMHGIFVGEIQALEGAGRTCFDFDGHGTRGARSP